MLNFQSDDTQFRSSKKACACRLHEDSVRAKTTKIRRHDTLIHGNAIEIWSCIFSLMLVLGETYFHKQFFFGNFYTPVTFFFFFSFPSKFVLKKK